MCFRYSTYGATPSEELLVVITLCVEGEREHSLALLALEPSGHVTGCLPGEACTGKQIKQMMTSAIRARKPPLAHIPVAFPIWIPLKRQSESPPRETLP